ncbi:acetylornithine transaminase [Micromonospora sp. WMMC241]|nr:acetylornithine transaminase [Micromonospora sp. WMMC241]MCZ7440035.1 acetylornithine transaminase [Micromonospora sp. WMMC241]
MASDVLSAESGLRRRFEDALMPNYGTPPLVISHGSGSRVWDTQGHAYLDLIAGIAVSALGHAHPALVEAVCRQVGRLAHISNLYLHEPEVLLAERLLHLLGGDGRVFFANSGTEANEAALKLVRRHAGTGRSHVVAAWQSFHGRSMGSLALAGKPAIRDPFAPFGFDVRFVPYGDTEALARAVTPECAGVFLEPIQGEAGIVEPPPHYLRAARDRCDETGAVLVLDEVQSGIGRTGEWFHHLAVGVRPDVVTLAKGLGGGLPIAACVGFGRFGSVFAKGDHGSTFGANPVACAAALAVLEVIERDDLLANARTVGGVLRDGIARTDHPLLRGVRGRGLWLGIVLAGPYGTRVEEAARQAGFLINAVQPDVVRLSPPLVLTVEEARAFLDALPGILTTALDAEVR